MNWKNNRTTLMKISQSKVHWIKSTSKYSKREWKVTAMFTRLLSDSYFKIRSKSGCKESIDAYMFLSTAGTYMSEWVDDGIMIIDLVIFEPENKES